MQTPVLEIDLAVVAERLRRLRQAFPDAQVHYAVKANPHPDVLATISAGGGCFDTATPAEISAALATGIHPNKLVFSNPVKRRADIADAHARGVEVSSTAPPRSPKSPRPPRGLRYWPDSPPAESALTGRCPASSAACRTNASTC